MDAAVQQLIKEHAPYFTPLDNGKILCSLNGHEFPAQLGPLQAFINGKKYNTLKIRKESEDLAKKYEPLLIQSRNAPEMLFCALTGQLLAKSEKAIKLHMDGKRFQKQKEIYDKDPENHELWAEPDLDQIRAEMEEEAEEMQQDGLDVSNLEEEEEVDADAPLIDSDNSFEAELAGGDSDADVMVEDDEQPAAAAKAKKKGQNGTKGSKKANGHTKEQANGTTGKKNKAAGQPKGKKPPPKKKSKAN